MSKIGYTLVGSGTVLIGILYFYLSGTANRHTMLIQKDNGNSCKSDDHLFVIIMTSYPRKSGESPDYIKKSLRSILAQTYSNWELYVTGDYYEPDSEFRSLFKVIPNDKVFVHNLPSPGERLNLTGMQLWESGGVTAMNNAMDRAERRHECCRPNCKIYLTNLDDDDVWSPDHLRELLSVFIRFPSVVFTWTKGYYCFTSGAPYPPELVPQEDVNNWPKQFGSFVLHSSWGWKMDTFRGFRYRRQWDFPDNFTAPKVADYDLFEVVRSHILENKLNYYHSNRATIEHLVERGSKCTKKGDPWYPD